MLSQRRWRLCLWSRTTWWHHQLSRWRVQSAKLACYWNTVNCGPATKRWQKIDKKWKFLVIALGNDIVQYIIRVNEILMKIITWIICLFWFLESNFVNVTVTLFNRTVCVCVWQWGRRREALTPSLFCPVLASISCRARTDRDCSNTKLQMHRSGGTNCRVEGERNNTLIKTSS